MCYRVTTPTTSRGKITRDAVLAAALDIIDRDGAALADAALGAGRAGGSPGAQACRRLQVTFPRRPAIFRRSRLCCGASAHEKRS
jgi:hypothetical protein